MKQLLAALVIALLISPLFASGDAGDAPLRAFCMRLLNAADNSTVANATNETAPAMQLNTNRTGAYYAAAAALAEANVSINRMEYAGLPTLRARDAYVAAAQWLDGQAALEEIGSKADYSFVLDSANQISTMEKTSFSIKDELDVLGIRLANATEGANLTSATALRDSARAEFVDGRFEEAKSLIEQSYSEISSAESAAIHSRTLVESTRKNIETFLRDNWQPIAAIAAALVVLLFLFQKRIRRFMLTSKYNSLLHEREVLQGMLRELQKNYFDRGTVNEMSYHIKTKKFGDLIRNINRQLPLLKEELKRI